MDYGSKRSIEDGDSSPENQDANVDDARWICIRSQPKRELFAAENLCRQSYRCFVPTVPRVVRHARRAKKIKEALFPRYLFINLDLGVQQWRPILGTFGVSDVIMQDGRPKPVPIGVVEGLMAAIDADGCMDFRHHANVGDSVRLMAGPFFGLIGRLERLDSQGRVSVLLDILGGPRVVHASRTALQTVSAQ